MLKHYVFDTTRGFTSTPRGSLIAFGRFPVSFGANSVELLTGSFSLKALGRVPVSFGGASHLKDTKSWSFELEIHKVLKLWT